MENFYTGVCINDNTRNNVVSVLMAGPGMKIRHNPIPFRGKYLILYAQITPEHGLRYCVESSPSPPTEEDVDKFEFDERCIQHKAIDTKHTCNEMSVVAKLDGRKHFKRLNGSFKTDIMSFIPFFHCEQHRRSSKHVVQLSDSYNRLEQEDANVNVLQFTGTHTIQFNEQPPNSNDEP